jgi:hypothetical protein
MKKNLMKNIYLSLIIISGLFLLLLFCGCSIISNLTGSINQGNTVTADSTPKIKIDENELRNIEGTVTTIEMQLDTSDEANVSEDKIRDPFMPFFAINNSSGSQSQKNKLTVEKIYSEAGVFFVEINFNDSIYKLKLDDEFAKIYQIRAINVDSIVLLKGDEIITLFINEAYYD